MREIVRTYSRKEIFALRGHPRIKQLFIGREYSLGYRIAPSSSSHNGSYLYQGILIILFSGLTVIKRTENEDF
jgi:hypothetical protein